ncbi:hypothetical protein GCM10027614_59990 [Micromonospora vulcania]
MHQQPKPTYVEDYVGKIVSDKEIDAEMARELLWHLLDARNRVSSLMNRAMIGTLATGAAFELLNRQLISEASAGGIRLAKLDPLRLLLPVLLAYLFLRVTVLAREAKLLETCFHELARQRFPGFHSSNINYLLIPPAGFAVGEVPTQLTRMGQRTRAIYSVLVGGEIAIMGFAPPVIIIYMYVQLFRREGLDHPAVWIGLATVIALLAAAYATLSIEANTRGRKAQAQPSEPPAPTWPPPVPRTGSDAQP